MWLGLLLPLVLMSGCYNPESPSVTASEFTRDGVKLTVRGLQVRKLGGSGPEFYYPSRPIQLSLRDPESGEGVSCTVNIHQPNNSPARPESDSHVVATQCEGPMAGATDQTTDAEPAPTIRFSCQPLSESARDFSCHITGLRSATAYSVHVGTEIDNWNHRQNQADVDSVSGGTEFETLPLPAPSLVLDTSGQLRPIRIASQGSGLEIGSALKLDPPQESWSPAQVQTERYSSLAIEGYEQVPRFDDLIVGDYNGDGLEDLLAVSLEAPPVILQAQKGSAAYLRRDLQLDSSQSHTHGSRVAQVKIDGQSYMAIADGPSQAVTVYRLSHRIEQGQSRYSLSTLSQIAYGQDQTSKPPGSAILSVALAPRYTQAAQTGQARNLADELLVAIGHKAPDHSVGYTLCPLKPELKHLGQCQSLSAEPALKSSLNTASQTDTSTHTSKQTTWNGAKMLLRDFNGDGYTDVLQVRQGQLQLGSASGTFSERHDPTTQTPARVFQDSASTEPTASVAYTDAQALDLDQDGDIDLLVQAPTQGTYAYYNRGDGVFSTQPSPAISAIAGTDAATQAGPSSPNTLPRYLKARQIGHTTTVVLMDEHSPQRWSSHAQTITTTQSALGELERNIHLHADQVPEYLQQDYRTLKEQLASAQTSAPDALRRARQIAIRLYNDKVIELAARQAQQYPQCTDLSAKSFEEVHDCAKQVFAQDKDPLGLSKITSEQESAELQVIQNRQIQDGSGPRRIQDGDSGAQRVLNDDQAYNSQQPTAVTWRDYPYGQLVMGMAHRLLKDGVAHNVDKATLELCTGQGTTHTANESFDPFTPVKDYGRIELFHQCFETIEAYENAAQVNIHDGQAGAVKATEGSSCWPLEGDHSFTPQFNEGVIALKGTVQSNGTCQASWGITPTSGFIASFNRYFTRRQPRAQVLSLDHGRQLMVYTRPQGGVQVAVGDTQNGTTQCRTIGTESDKDHIAACHWIWADPQLSWSAPYSALLSDQPGRQLTQLPEGAVNLNPTAQAEADRVYACLAEGEGTRPLSGQLVKNEDGWVCKTPKDSGTQVSNGLQTATQFRVLISHQIREAAQNPRRQLEAGGGDGYKRVIFDESTHPALVNFTSWLRSLTGDKQTEGEGRIYLNESSQQWSVGVKSWPDQIVLDVNSGTPVIRMRNQDHQQDLPWLVSSVGLTGADTETGIFTGLSFKLAGMLNAGTQLAAAYDVISPTYKRMRLWLDRDGELWRSSLKIQSMGQTVDVPRLMHLSDSNGMSFHEGLEAEHRLVYRLEQCDSEKGQCTWYLDAAAMSYPQQEMFFVCDDAYQLKGLVTAGCLGASIDQPNDTHWLRLNEKDQTLAWSRSSASSGFYLTEGVQWESALQTPKAECQYVRHQTSMPLQDRIVYGHSGSDSHRVVYLTATNTGLQPFVKEEESANTNFVKQLWTSAIDWFSNTARTIASGTSQYTKDRQELLAFYKTHASLYQNISQAVQSLTGSAFIEAHTLNLKEDNQQQAWYVMNGEPINANGSGTENNQEAIYGQSQFARVPFVTLSSIDMFISNVKLAMQRPENQALCKECGFAPDWPFQISEEALRKQAIDSYKAYGYIDWASIFAPEIVANEMFAENSIVHFKKMTKSGKSRSVKGENHQCLLYRVLIDSPFKSSVLPGRIDYKSGVCFFDIDIAVLRDSLNNYRLYLKEHYPVRGLQKSRNLSGRGTGEGDRVWREREVVIEQGLGGGDEMDSTSSLTYEIEYEDVIPSALRVSIPIDRFSNGQYRHDISAVDDVPNTTFARIRYRRSLISNLVNVDSYAEIQSFFTGSHIRLSALESAIGNFLSSIDSRAESGQSSTGNPQQATMINTCAVPSYSSDEAREVCSILIDAIARISVNTAGNMSLEDIVRAIDQVETEYRTVADQLISEDAADLAAESETIRFVVDSYNAAFDEVNNGYRDQAVVSSLLARAQNQSDQQAGRIIATASDGLCCAIQSKGALPLTPDGFIPRAPSRACPVA